ncbi:MAG: alpha/beta hydrolase [Acidimicrobiaceae bacterium]|jgi:pimeloyl-ACP methyl ester carboxylesterase|nr:alpha/beta hydrolase [Acidimicrobiaceae bacterium]
MASFEYGNTEIHFDEYGSGFPVLLIAPGGMQSAASFWESTPWNPINQLKENFRVIAMDQRNAGRSSGPIAASDGWATYTRDQLALLDHLQVDEFHAVGMCIGGPYVMGLIEAAPERVAAGVLFQTIGLNNNREAFYDMFDSWAQPLSSERPDVPDGVWAEFRSNMYGSDKFLFNVDEAFVQSVRTPLLVFEGDDLYHPSVSSLAVAELAKNSTLIRDWKSGAALDSAKNRFYQFLVNEDASKT